METRESWARSWPHRILIANEKKFRLPARIAESTERHPVYSFVTFRECVGSRLLVATDEKDIMSENL